MLNRVPLWHSPIWYHIETSTTNTERALHLTNSRNMFSWYLIFGDEKNHLSSCDIICIKNYMSAPQWGLEWSVISIKSGTVATKSRITHIGSVLHRHYWSTLWAVLKLNLLWLQFRMIMFYEFTIQHVRCSYLVNRSIFIYPIYPYASPAWSTVYVSSLLVLCYSLS